MIDERATTRSCQEAKYPATNNVGGESRQISQHSTRYLSRGAQKLRRCGDNLPRNKCYIYLQLRKRLKIRLEPVCATQYYIFTINKPPASFGEFPCWSAVDLAISVRDLQTWDSSCLDPDRLSPTPESNQLKGDLMMEPLWQWVREWGEACTYARECVPDLSFFAPHEPYSALASIAGACFIVWWWNDTKIRRILRREAQVGAKFSLPDISTKELTAIVGMARTVPPPSENKAA
jgi:hypothetical protein